MHGVLVRSCHADKLLCADQHFLYVILPCSRVRMKDTTFSSKAYGTHEYKDLTIEGRVQLDVYMALQRDHKLSSYTLNAVSLCRQCHQFALPNLHTVAVKSLIVRSCKSTTAHAVDL